jgi:hypothetical protein
MSLYKSYNCCAGKYYKKKKFWKELIRLLTLFKYRLLFASFGIL